MSHIDSYSAERLMDLRVQEERRQAELRRLLSEAQAGRAGWLSQQRCRALCQLGRVFVSVGQRLLQAASPPALPAAGQVSKRG
jgi:hypothetical protein